MSDDDSVDDNLSSDNSVEKKRKKKKKKKSRTFEKTAAEKYETFMKDHEDIVKATALALGKRGNKLTKMDDKFPKKCVQHHSFFASLVSQLEKKNPDTFTDYMYEDAAKTGMKLASQKAYIRSMEDIRTLSYGIMEMASQVDIHIFSDYPGLNKAVFIAMSILTEKRVSKFSGIELLAVLDNCVNVARGIDVDKEGDPILPPDYSFHETESEKYRYLNEMFSSVKTIDNDGGAYGLMLMVAIAFLPCVPIDVVKGDANTKTHYPLKGLFETVRLEATSYGERWRNGLRAVGYMLLADTDVDCWTNTEEAAATVRNPKSFINNNFGLQHNTAAPISTMIALKHLCLVYVSNHLFRTLKNQIIFLEEIDFAKIADEDHLKKYVSLAGTLWPLATSFQTRMHSEIFAKLFLFSSKKGSRSKVGVLRKGAMNVTKPLLEAKIMMSKEKMLLALIAEIKPVHERLAFLERIIYEGLLGGGDNENDVKKRYSKEDIFRKLGPGFRLNPVPYPGSSPTFYLDEINEADVLEKKEGEAILSETYYQWKFLSSFDPVDETDGKLASAEDHSDSDDERKPSPVAKKETTPINSDAGKTSALKASPKKKKMKESDDSDSSDSSSSSESDSNTRSGKGKKRSASLSHKDNEETSDSGKERKKRSQKKHKKSSQTEIPIDDSESDE